MTARTEANRLLERLVSDPAFRAQFEVDPAETARAAGFDGIADELELDDVDPMQTLEVRESRSSLAGALMAAAAEGLGLFEVGGRLLGPGDAHAATVPNRPGAGGAPAPLAQPANIASSPAARLAARAVQAAEQQPVAAAAAQQVNASAPASPVWHADEFGMHGTGGPTTPELQALLEDKNVAFDASGIADLKAGRIDPRVVSLLVELSQHHRLVISSMSSDHPEYTTGGSVSNHYYGRAFDIATVDGQRVDPNNDAARKLALDLAHLDPRIRPSEIGSPWALPGAAYFTDAEHQNHLHVGYDSPIDAHWQAPPDAAPAGPPAAAAASPPAPVNPDDLAGSADQEDGGGDGSDDGGDSSDDGGDSSDDGGDSSDDGGDDGGGDDSQSDDSSDDASGDDSGDDATDSGDGDSDAPGEGSNGEDANDDNAGDSSGSDSSDSSSSGSSDSSDSSSSDSSSSDSSSSDSGGSDSSSSSSDSSDSSSSASDSSDSSSSGSDSSSSGSGADSAADSASSGTYPGNDASQQQVAAWMGAEAEKRGLPPELPVMASMVESGLRNLPYGDADSVGLFQMRASVWDQGAYKGYANQPELQLRWFLDHAATVKQQRLAAGLSVDDPKQYGDWIADVERPAAQYRGRYQLRLDDAQALLEQAGAKPGSVAAQHSGNDAIAFHAVDPTEAAGGSAATATTAALQAGIVETAKSQLGIPYEWGGEAKLGSSTDCSGLLQAVLAKHGVQIPRTTYDQFTTGRPVSLDQLQPGDAVFFDESRRGPEHVGIYIGGGSFIEDPHTGSSVRVADLKSRGGFVGARRYIDA